MSAIRKSPAAIIVAFSLATEIGRMPTNSPLAINDVVNSMEIVLTTALGG
jgi:hypothetical protein